MKKIAPPYPVPSFAFKLNFNPSLGKTPIGFLEVSGLAIQSPQSSSDYNPESTDLSSDLILRRGLMYRDAFTKWYTDSLEHGKRKKRTIKIELLDRQGTIVAAWNVNDALPIWWDLNTLNAMENALAIETVGFSYRSVNRLM